MPCSRARRAQPGSVFDHDAEELAASRRANPRVRRTLPRRTHSASRRRARAARRAPDITLFVEIKRESLAQFGHDQVVSAVAGAIGQRHARCVVISFDLAAVHRAREYASLPIGWVLDGYALTPSSSAKRCGRISCSATTRNSRARARCGAVPGAGRCTKVRRGLPLALALAGSAAFITSRRWPCET